MILRRVIEHFRKQEWTAIFLDFVIVVMGVFIGIQVSNWNAGREERAAEKRYLARLSADTEANIAELQALIAGHERSKAALADLEAAIVNGTDAPPQASLQRVLCRFFVQPGAALQQATYDELVASGALDILHDEKLRILLSRQQAAVEEAARLDILTPAVQRAAPPLDDYRQWSIIRGGEEKGADGGAACRFDVDGMRADPRTRTRLAQLYRDQDVTQRFRQDVLDITLEIAAQLKDLGGPASAGASMRADGNQTSADGGNR